MVELKIVTGKNAAMLEKNLANYFKIGFSVLGNLVHNPADGLVQMLARNSEPLQPEIKRDEAPGLKKVED